MTYKKLLALPLMALILVGCQSANKRNEIVTPKNLPDWYINQTSPSSSVIYGFGQGHSQSEARKKALSSISEVIETKIQSQLECSWSSKNDEITQSCHEEIRSASASVLSGTSVDKVHYEGGTYFVRVIYDLSSTAIKIERFAKNSDLDCTDANQVMDNRLLLSSPLMKELSSSLDCLPRMDVYRRDSLWMLQNTDLTIPLVDTSLTQLWPELNSPYIDLTLPARLKHGEYFFIDVVVKKPGYFTVFAIDQGGQVQVMIDETKSPRQRVRFPNEEEYDGLIAEIIDEREFTKDLYVAALCEQPHSSILAPMVSEEHYTKDTDNYLFGEFIKSFKECEMSTQVVGTSKP